MTHDIVELRIRISDSQTISFIAGQFIRLDSKKYLDKEAVTRTYSISSPPSDTTHIELIIRRVPNGICTTWIFDHVKEQEAVTFAGPFGKFHLSDSNSPVIFIAGGSGMSSLWSILRDMLEKGITRNTSLFFGALTQKDLYFVDELDGIAARHSWFRFIPALSNEPPESDWKGERGLITDVVTRSVNDTSQYEAYVCGSPGMIDACVNVLTNKGMSPEKLFFDKFV